MKRGRHEKVIAGRREKLLRPFKDAIIDSSSRFDIVEEYKIIRTNIMYSFVETGSKVLCMTSPSPYDGKTTASINLGITFAQTGARVLVMDCDLRKPNVHRYLKLQAEPGITNVLGAFCPLNDAIQKTSYEGLDALVCGHLPPNPAELLASGAMVSLLDYLKGTYEYIFVDTPPVNTVTDATVISKLVSGVIIIARQSITTYDEVRITLEKLKQAHARVLGFMLNDAKEETDYYSNKKYCHSYYNQYSNYTPAMSGVKMDG